MAQFCTASLVAFLLCISTLALGQDDADLQCTEQSCESSACPEIRKNCEDGKLFASPSPCNCCEYCVHYRKEGEECVVGDNGQPTPEFICGPRLTCVKPKSGSATCQPMIGKICLERQLEYDERRKEGKLMVTETKPRCDDRGNFGPVHCNHGGMCYCVAKDGSRIFGEIPFTSTHSTELMNCACSRFALQSALVGGKTTMTVRCDSSGSYDKLQCVNENCACVSPANATFTSDVVRFYQVSELECYAENTEKNAEYQTPCERARLATLTSDAIGIRLQTCQPDGGYEPVRIVNYLRMCVTPNGTQIEHFEAWESSGDAKRMNCKCARARMTMRDYGLTELPSCELYGNYKGLQCLRGLCYCVDLDGVQTEKEVEQNNAQVLPCYKTRRDEK